MKIAILGTRGIPNNYGGFEQFAEQLSVRLAEHGHEVIVFNPSYHPFIGNKYKNVSIVNISCPEKIFGGAAHFIYDYFCLKDAVKRKVNIVLMCGYGTSAPALFLVNKQITKVIINMDGFEWKRSKYNFFTKIILKWFEKVAIKYSNKIVADHPVIRNYYHKKYNVISALISYGAEIPQHFDESIIKIYGLNKNKYFLVVARNEPENQIDFIISAWQQSGSTTQICIVTNSSRCLHKYSKQKEIVIIIGIYDYNKLSSLRHFSLACIHGHTVGGTNPSLLEAMAAKSILIAHDNSFHRDILENNALYFDSKKSLIAIFRKDFKLNYIEDDLTCESQTMDKVTLTIGEGHKQELLRQQAILKNLNKINNFYQWGIIAEKYLKVFNEICHSERSIAE